MRLFEIPELQEALQDFHKDMPPGIPLDNYTLVEIEPGTEDLSRAKQVFEVRLPQDARALLERYNFGGLDLGGVWFGRQNNPFTEELILINTPNETMPQLNWWWPNDEWPEGILHVAGSDGFVVLLDTPSGRAMAYDRTETWRDAKVVAQSLPLLVQGAATAYLECRKRGGSTDYAFERWLSGEVGAEPGSSFWREIAQAYA